jgi:glycosyltransferase involved in cell wall biosynthesis
MESISVAIVARNEAVNIGRTLDSVQWADEIVLIDSGSTDETVAIALAKGATVYTEAWRGYGAQVNAALDRCTCTWILNIDADEVVSPALAEEIRQVLSEQTPRFVCYTVNRLNQIFGRWMRHGGLYPDRKVRLFRKGSARLAEDTEPHATPKTNARVGLLRGQLLHYQYLTLSAYVDHMNSYSTASVPLLIRRGKVSRSWWSFCLNVLVNPVFTFAYNYVVRLGFLDGREGLLFHMNHSLYVSWKYGKAWKGEVRVEGVDGSAQSPEKRFLKPR